MLLITSGFKSALSVPPGVPLIICVVVLIVNREVYGSHLYNDAQSSLNLLDSSDSL